MRFWCSSYEVSNETGTYVKTAIKKLKATPFKLPPKMNMCKNSGNQCVQIKVATPWKTDLSNENVMAAAEGPDLAVENIVVAVAPGTGLS
jgi:hypothetical protein